MKSRVRINADTNKLIFGKLEMDIKIVYDELYDREGNKIIINKLHNFYVIFEDYVRLYLEYDDEIFTVDFDEYLLEYVLDYKYTLDRSKVNRLEHAVVTTVGRKRIERILYPYEVIKNLDYYYGNNIDLKGFFDANSLI